MISASGGEPLTMGLPLDSAGFSARCPHYRLALGTRQGDVTLNLFHFDSHFLEQSAAPAMPVCRITVRA